MIQLFKNSSSIWLIVLVQFFWGCKSNKAETTLPFINKPDFTPEWISEDSIAYPKIHTIPAFSFYDQDGKIVTEKTITGKIYVANFIFTRCAGICPVMTSNMNILQQKFKDDDEVIFLSHSVTPDIDSVPVLKKYALDKGVISGKWHLLTGNQKEIYRIARQEYFAGDTIGYYQTGNEFLHTENFILVDKKKRIRGVYNGTLALEMDRLIVDIETLQQEED